MSLNRYAVRRDANEPELVKVARKLGAVMLKHGPLDWWCGYRHRWWPVEIKVEKGRMRPLQKQFLALCQQSELPVQVWRSVECVVAALNAPREKHEFDAMFKFNPTFDGRQ